MSTIVAACTLRVSLHRTRASLAAERCACDRCRDYVDARHRLYPACIHRGRLLQQQVLAVAMVSRLVRQVFQREDPTQRACYRATAQHSIAHLVRARAVRCVNRVRALHRSLQSSVETWHSRQVDARVRAYPMQQSIACRARNHAPEDQALLGALARCR